MAIDYKEKIRKLLALAESPVEAEARAALLKARQLMAEHKLTERECREAEKQAVKDVLTDITCSKRREPWIVPLSATIGESYCCKGYRKRYHGQQTQHVGFIGLEDDVEICIAVYVLFLRRAAARYSLHDLCWVRHGGQPGHHRGQAHGGVQKGRDSSPHNEAAGRGGGAACR